MVKLNEKQTALEESFEEVTSEFTAWKPSVNDTITGKIVRRIKSNYGVSSVIENKDGEFILPNHAILSALLEKCAIGDTVKINCVGMEKSKTPGKNDMTLYKVFIKKA